MTGIFPFNSVFQRFINAEGLFHTLTFLLYAHLVLIFVFIDISNWWAWWEDSKSYLLLNLRPIWRHLWRHQWLWRHKNKINKKLWFSADVRIWDDWVLDPYSGDASKDLYSHQFNMCMLLCLYFSTIGNRLLNENRRKKIKVKRFPQFLLCMYVCLCVCVFVCLFVCRRSTDSIVQHRRLKIWHIYLYVNISNWYLLLFSIFDFFRSYSPFLFFYYFLYFMPASQQIVKINTSNWIFGLVEYIMYNDIDIAKLWRHIWRHEF